MKNVILSLCMISAITAFTACTKCKPGNTAGFQAFTDSLQKANPSCTCEPYLSEYQWKQQTIYILGYKNPACSWAAIYFDVQFQDLSKSAIYDFNNFFQEARLVGKVWECRE